MTTVTKKFREIVDLLKEAGIQDAAKEAELLISEVLQINKKDIYSKDIIIPEKILTEIDKLALRRAEGEPIQYIIGHVDFCGLKIKVGRGVLIPRPETELLVMEAIDILRKSKSKEAKEELKILDLCTGSGCIAIALAKNFPSADVYGIDISEIAIEYAIKNALENGVNNVHFMRGDLFNIVDHSNIAISSVLNSSIIEGERDFYGSKILSLKSPFLSPITPKSFDLIASNPPYIKTSDIPQLQREIRDYEPLIALNGGEDGLAFLRRILKGAPMFLKESGILILEIGFHQSKEIKGIASDVGFRNISFKKDFAGVERIFIGDLKS